MYLAPPGGAVVLSIDEKTQVQALDWTQPVLPVAFSATEKRTHDYVRNGTTNLFTALNVTTGEVLGECKANRNGKSFLAFLKKAVKPPTGKEIHVVLDNLSTHTTPEVKEWLAKNVLQCQRPGQADLRLHQRLERERETLHLDRNCRRDPRQGPIRPDQREETRQ